MTTRYARHVLKSVIWLMVIPPIFWAIIRMSFIGDEGLWWPTPLGLVVIISLQALIVWVAMMRIDALELKSQHIFDGREKFFGMVVHDLKVPLSNIVMCTELWKDGTFDIQKTIDIVNSSAVAISNLIEDLLELIALQAKSLPINKSNVDINSLVKEVSDAFICKNTVKNIDFVFRINVESCYADKKRLRQILTNLISNAIKFTPEFGMIGIKVYNKDKYHHFEVNDNGIGIPEHLMDRLFTPFAVGTNHESSTGLGLSIVRHLVLAHNGYVWVDREYKGGCRICFKLPMEEECVK